MDHRRTFEDYGHSSLAVSVSLCAAALVSVAMGNAAEVTDEQHLIQSYHCMWVSFPICLMTHSDSGSECQYRD